MQKNKFKTTDSRYSFYRLKTLPFPSNTAFSISNIAIEMLNEIYQEKTSYKKAGVIVTEIIPSNQKQFHLFDDENPKYQKIMQVMDDYHKRIGERKIRLGNQDLQRTWKMKQHHLSNKYTTNFKEILEIKCH